MSSCTEGHVFVSPTDGKLKFLDVSPKLEKGLCCEYGKVTTKPILPAISCHSKLLKGGLVWSLVFNSLNMSCCHFVTPTSKQTALSKQTEKLKRAGYATRLIMSKLFTHFSGACNQKHLKERTNNVVALFYHNVSHSLKVTASRFDARVLFWNGFRLSFNPIFEVVFGLLKKSQKTEPRTWRSQCGLQYSSCLWFLYALGKWASA